MSDGGTFLAHPPKGLSRVSGLASCQDCGFEACGEIRAGEEDGVMRRRCGGCEGARYPGLVEYWPDVRLAWLPELPQATCVHLVRTLQVVELIAEEAGEPGEALARALAGARRWRTFLAGREEWVRTALGARDSGQAALILQAMGADRRALADRGLRILPAPSGRGRVEGWLEAGTFHGLTVESIEHTGGFNGR